MNPRFIEGWFTGEELSEFNKWSGTYIEIGQYHYAIPTKADFPFRPFVEKFFLMKESNPKGSPEYDCGKIMLNSLYGKCVAGVDNLLTKMKDTGNLWSPFYGATITGHTRAAIARFIRYQNHSGIVGVATDGIIIEGNQPNIPPRPYDVTIDGIESNLGEWELEMDNADALILMSGVYSIRSRSLKDENGNPKTKTTMRGNYSLFLEKSKPDAIWPLNWFEFCEEFSEKSIVVRSAKWRPHHQPFSIGEARVRGDFSLINQFRIKRATVKVMGDSNKRLWVGRKPKKFGDLLKSRFKSKPHQRFL
jgi:hypothetical protein